MSTSQFCCALSGGTPGFWYLHSCKTLSCSFTCLVRSPLFLNFLEQFACEQKKDARVWWLTRCDFKLLSNGNDWSQSSHWNLDSWCTYLWWASEARLLNAFVHTSQYSMLWVCWWCTLNSWILSQTLSHILHPNVLGFLLCLRPNLCVLKSPLGLVEHCLYWRCLLS